MIPVETWWTDPFGLPGGPEGAARPSRPLVLLLAAAVLLAALGALVAIRHEDSGMEAFCDAFRDVTNLPKAPSSTRFSDIANSQRLQDGIAVIEEAQRLASRSGNPRIVNAFAAQEATTARAGTGGNPEQEAERSVQTYMVSFEAAGEECDAAGHPVIEGGPPSDGLPARD